MLKSLTKSMVVLAFMGATVGAQAGLIVSADSVTANTMGTAAGSTDNLSNQTGLSSGFTSGVTDFTTYIGTNPTHALNDPGNAWAGNSGPVLGFIDFDLGDLFTVNSFALWTQSNSNGVNRFELIVDSVSAGFFNSSLVNSAPIPVQIFDIGDLLGQTVRLNVLSNHGGNNVNIGEVAFEVGDTSTVPVPATIALFSLGLAGLGWSRRKKA